MHFFAEKPDQQSKDQVSLRSAQQTKIVLLQKSTYTLYTTSQCIAMSTI